MASLQQNTRRNFETGPKNGLQMAAATVIYEGMAVGIQASTGYARPLQSGDAFAGIAESQADNSKGAAGATSVSVIERGDVELQVTGSVLSSIGALVYASDDNTFSTGSGGSFIGRIKRYRQNGNATVQFNASGPGSAGAGVTAIAFSAAVPFSSAQADMGFKNVTAVIPFTVNATGAVRGNSTTVTLIADGTNAPTITGFKAHSSDAGYVNTGTPGVSGVPNTLAMWFDGATYYYSWSQPSDLSVIPFVTAPVAPSFSVAPSIIGTPSVGVASAYTYGTVAGYPNPTITQQWTLDGVDIPGATGATYTPQAGDATKALRVRQIATNTSGSVGSTSASATVGAVATAPGAPTGLTLGTATSTTQPLTWTPPVSNGGSAITDYVVQWAPAGSGTWTTFADGTSTLASATVTGLTASTSYDFRVAAVNAVATGSNSSTATGSTAAASSLQIIREATLTSSSNLVTESGDGTNGWNYTGSAGSSFTASQAYNPNLSLPTATDGEFRCGIGTVHTASASPMLGFGGTATANFGTPHPYNMDCGGSGGAYRTFLGGSLRTTGVVSADNDLMRIKRTGTTVTWEYSRDGGTTWNVIDTATGQTTPRLYPIASFLGASSANNLRGVGMT